MGYIFSVKKNIGKKQKYIMGRLVNLRNTYQVVGKFIKEKEVSSFIENDYVWFKPFKISTNTVKEQQVYNFEIDCDNSYIVENVACHNCQPFSIAGKQKGFDDPRTNIFWKVIEILKLHKPRCVVLENVKNLVSHDNGDTFKTIITSLEKEGYHIKYKVLNTEKITNIPQHRERIYIVCFRDKKHHEKFNFNFPEIQNKIISDLLEKNVPDKYYYNDETNKIHSMVIDSVIKENTVYQFRRVYVRENKSGVCPTLTANMGGGGHNVPLILDDNGARKLTPKECFNFQGFPENYIFPKLSDTKLYKLAGNAVSVPVIRLIANKIIEAMK
jgi:DNA (cytosine-5)-methyltransferase 1